MSVSLQDRLRRVASRYPDRIALWVEGEHYSYRELFARAEPIAAQLARRPEPFCVVYCGKNLTRYVAILASVLAGKAFVPLSTTAPLSYCQRALDRLADQAVAVVDSGDRGLDGRFHELLPPSAVLGVAPAAGAGVADADLAELPATPDNVAYVMFTSGSTGVPKAVPVTVANLTSYLSGASALFAPTCHDRFAQVNAITFDLSVHDIFLPWWVGASVYALPDNAVYAFPDLIREHDITFWLSVPTTGQSLADLRALRPGCLPSLRVGLFCGEPLPTRLARQWHIAAPDSRLFNIYGPTECTIAVTAFEVRADLNLPQVVPIGLPYPDQRVGVVDPELREVEDGQVGELCLQGSQLVPGYYGDARQTEQRFVTRPDATGIWYRTGDLVARHDAWGLVFRGRRDDQLQVRGFRVERLEVESLIRNAVGSGTVAVVGWPVVEGSIVQGLVAFITDTGTGPAEIRRRISTELPEHMWPSQIHVGPLPQNGSAKVDYQALRRRLAEA